MEYVYATLTLNELGQELNEANITTVLEAAGADVVESRVKAIVAALEDVDLDDLGLEAGIAPAPTPGSETAAAPASEADAEHESPDAIAAGTDGEASAASDAEAAADPAEDESEEQ